MSTDNPGPAATSGSTRPPACAGSFYPAKRDRLMRMLNGLLDKAAASASRTQSSAAPKAIIVPHAGYIYSGPTAAKAYAMLAAARGAIRRVVLAGPAHRIALNGIALSGHSHFATPLGAVPLDRDGMARLGKLPQARSVEAAHEQEHSLEVQLPFLQTCLDDFSLLPMVIGHVPPDAVRQALKMVWGSAETLIVISSDLSHFHDYATAQRIDRATSAAITAMQLERIGPQQACGCMPLNGLLALARDEQMRIAALEISNSGDTAGDRERVVGYGAYALTECYSADDKQHLLELAWRSIRTVMESGKRLVLDLNALNSTLTSRRAAFITLTKDGQLRGCMGATEATGPLAQGVMNSAFKAAFADPRFPAVTADELVHIDMQISILTPASSLGFTDEAELIAQLRPAIDGLIIRHGERQATFLPAVWASIRSPDCFLRCLKQKAGIADEESIEQAWTYRTISFGSGAAQGRQGMATA